MGILSRIFGRALKLPAKKEVVTFDDNGVVRTMCDGRTESVAWSDLQEVRIITTDDGPLAPDVFWMLFGTSGGCAVPGEAVEADGLLKRLQLLPGFDNEAVIRAMGSTDNASFVCWQRDRAP